MSCALVHPHLHISLLPLLIKLNSTLSKITREDNQAQRGNAVCPPTTQEWLLLNSFSLAPTLISLGALGPPCPRHLSILKGYWTSPHPTTTTPRRVTGCNSSAPPQPSSRRVGQGWAAWLPSLGLYLLADPSLAVQGNHQKFRE